MLVAPQELRRISSDVCCLWLVNFVHSRNGFPQASQLQSQRKLNEG